VSALASIRNELLNRRIPGQLQFNPDEETAGVPLLREIEHTASLIPQAFASRHTPEYLSLVDDIPRSSLLTSDAFVNPDHLRFALKGCLAASICYLIYNALNWPGISTSVTTCLLTALSTIGSSHQKQMLRSLGAVFGGFVRGMGSQIFILPHLDSIGGFVLLFVVVTALSVWFIVLRHTGRTGFLPGQCERIQNADLPRGSERPRRWHLARPVRNVVDI
jgi:multidrug resistance protein MdtO